MVNALIFPLDLVASDQPQEILAFHGWGFDASWWHPWHTWLTAQGHTVACYDRGYFGHPQAVAFGASSSRIAAPTIVTPQEHSPSHRLKKTLWCHSLGTYFCPVELLAQADRLVLWASFLHFHPQDPQAQNPQPVLGWLRRAADLSKPRSKSGKASLTIARRSSKPAGSPDCNRNFSNRCHSTSLGIRAAGCC